MALKKATERKWYLLWILKGPLQHLFHKGCLRSRRACKSYKRKAPVCTWHSQCSRQRNIILAQARSHFIHVSFIGKWEWKLLSFPRVILSVNWVSFLTVNDTKYIFHIKVRKINWCHFEANDLCHLNVFFKSFESSLEIKLLWIYTTFKLQK